MRIPFLVWQALFFTSCTLAAPAGPAAAKPQLSDYETVRRAQRFSIGPVSFALEITQTEISFRSLLRSPTAAQDCRRLLAEATTAGQLYALLGLKLLDDPGYATAAPRYRLSRAQVNWAGGCTFGMMPVARLAKDIDSGGYE